MKKKVLAIPIITAALFFSKTVYGEVLDYKTEINDETITVTGTVAPSNEAESLVLEILKPNCGFESGMAVGSVAFAEQLDLKEKENDFSFSFPQFKESGRYAAKLVCLTDGTEKSFEINIVKDSDFAEVLAELKNNMESQESFSSFLASGNNAYILRCDNIPDNIDRAKIESIMYAFLKTEINNIRSSKDSNALWCGSVTACMLNNGAANNMSDLDEYIRFNDEKIEKWYKAQTSNNAAAEKILQILKQKKYNKYSDLEEQIKRALILSVVKYPNGISNIGEVLADFSDVSGVTKIDETEKYRQAAGNDFSDFDKFIEYFKNLKTQSGTSSSSSGGSGGGGYIASGKTKAESDEQTPVVNMRFIDLDTVPWAYEAISTLADRGIINGRSDELFEPNDTVTREEFVKICVNICGLDSSDKTVVFSDEVSEEWYTGYLKAAYDSGLVRGRDDGTFGIGEPVSRQDMAVILYNIIKAHIDSVKEPQNKFDDAEIISEYAKDAVSCLSELGIINGTGDNLFSPLDTATRAEAAKMAFGILEYVK